MAGGAVVIEAVETYLTMRRAAGFELLNAAYLLRSFAGFAEARRETHVRIAAAIDWASQTATVAQRDERLKTICRFVRYMRAEDERHELPRSDQLRLPQDSTCTAHLLECRSPGIDGCGITAQASRLITIPQLRNPDRITRRHRTSNL